MSDTLSPTKSMRTEMADTTFVFEPCPPAPPPGGDSTRSKHLRYAIPPPPLTDLVEAFWLWQSDPAAHTKERVLPTGAMQLFLDLGDETSAPRMCGARSECVVVDTLAWVIGVQFKPGGAFPFLHVAAGELQDAHMPLDALWGSEAVALRDRLREAQTPADKFRVLERALLAQADRPLARHPAVAFALKEFQGGSPLTIGEVTRRVGLSPKKFIQLFTGEVGLTPKLFCRIRRFQAVLRRIRLGRPVEWTSTALECDYYDQSHFIRDFRAFCGLSPTAYLRVWGEHLRHAALVG
jgi:AraC-like DNA-binding protein